MSKDRLSAEEKSLSRRLKKALNSGDVTALKRLVKGGVDINDKFWYDSTLLHEAVSIGDLDIVKILVQYHAEVNAKNKDGRTPLHIATRAGKLQIVDYLLKAGAHINQETLDGQTALHIAIWWGKHDVIDALLKAGAQVNIPDNNGWHPLHSATRRNDALAVQKLVETYARMDCKITKGLNSSQTPVDLAVEVGHVGIAEYLLLHGAYISTSVNRKSVVTNTVKNKYLSVQQVMDTLDFFIQNGYMIQNDHWLKSGELPSELTNHKEWLQNCGNSIQSLSSLCRSAIRRQLLICTCGRSIIRKMKTLPLPNILMDYVMFKERIDKYAKKFGIDSTSYIEDNQHVILF